MLVHPLESSTALPVAPVPRLSIGMPLFNNARTLSRALESLRAQTFDDFVVIMSDDRSSDDTPDIAQAFADADPRFTLVRQPHNLNYGNFRFLVQRAETDLFMFAAGDDWWDPTFVASCVAALDADPQAVMATTRVRFVSPDGHEHEAHGTRPLTGSVTENLASYLRAPADNSRMYGVFRTDAARRSFPSTNHYAYDWTFSAATLRFGTHLEIAEPLMVRDITPTNKYLDYVRRDGRGSLSHLVPLGAMTAALVREMRVPMRGGVGRALAYLNLRVHINYMRRFHPGYMRLFGPWLERLLWRL